MLHQTFRARRRQLGHIDKGRVGGRLSSDISLHYAQLNNNVSSLSLRFCFVLCLRLCDWGTKLNKGYPELTDEVVEGGRELSAGGTTGRQLEPAAASGEKQSSRLPSDMVDVVVGRGRRRGQPRGAASTRMEGGVEQQQQPLLHRRGRQAVPESTEMLSSSRIDHADVICFSFFWGVCVCV